MFRQVLAASATMVALALSHPAFADTVNWATWPTTSGGTSLTGQLALPSGTITVTYSGDYFASNSDWHWGYTYPAFTGTTPSPTVGDHIQITGGESNDVRSITFSQPVVDPVMAIISLGQSGYGVNYAFDQPFTILSQGGGDWGGGTLTETGNTLTGYEGNGIIQFQGTYSTISWSAPDYEYWHGFTVGAVDAVPEPETYALLALGLGAMVVIGRRNRQG